MNRGLVVVILAVVAISIFLLATASSNTDVFGSAFPYFLTLNAAVVAGLGVLLGRQAWHLYRQYRRRKFGTRLRVRLTLMFTAMALIPAVILYLVSIFFVVRSIETWFDIRVERALESGVALARNTLDNLVLKARHDAETLRGQLAQAGAVDIATLTPLRENLGVSSITVLNAKGTPLVTVSPDDRWLSSVLPTAIELQAARSTGLFHRVDTSPEGVPVIRVIAVLGATMPGSTTDAAYLQLVQRVPANIVEQIEAVQTAYRDYQQIVVGKEGLQRIYALTLTITVLLSLLAALALAMYLSRKFIAPLMVLAEGTRAVAAGDYRPLAPIAARDELGVLTRSFDAMTQQLAQARQAAEESHAQIEAARAYLETILANLSTGVLAFDVEGKLTIANAAASRILEIDLQGCTGQPPSCWTMEPEFATLITELIGREPAGPTEWRRRCADGHTQVLLLHVASLPTRHGSGRLVVFDDVTDLVQAQRTAAWGEVARRLAHEIKNPLTPIQLSAERLRYKLADRLGPEERQMLERATQTIIDQVEAMKNLVNAFRDYARLPAPKKDWIELQALLRSVLVLYESSPARLKLDVPQEPLPALRADASQMRQVLHNLIQNAQDALEGRQDGMIRIEVRRNADTLILRVLDNGPGFPPELLRHAFEPYFTTKPKGTGLGLAVIKKILDDHGARVRLVNRAEGGAMVEIEFPLGDEVREGGRDG